MVPKAFNLSFLLCFLILLLSSCSDESAEEPVQQPQPTPTISALEQAQIDWLNNMMDIMEENSVNRKTINWTVFRNSVLNEARGLQSREQLDPVISTAITLLGDNHSFVRKPTAEFIVGQSILNCSLGSATVTDLENVGYVKVDAFSGSSEEAKDFAEDIQRTIAEQDNELLVGWVVDLRNNTGGNMWPMLAGIGPILGEGTVGYFIDPDDTKNEWGYFGGESRISGQVVIGVDQPYELLNPDPKVAVLFNRASASSGEAIIVAFKERPNTRSFGELSCGLSTANTGFNLGDNYTLFLTVATFADRAENLYGGRIAPDESIQDSGTLWARVEEWFNE